MELLDFENLPAGTKVGPKYAARGVVFSGSAIVDTDPAARSGSRVLRSGNPANEFHTGPLSMTFLSPQSLVRLFGGGTSEPVDGVLRAFDSAGTLVASDGPKPMQPVQFTTQFQVSTATPVITRVELEMGVTVFEAIDDLEFDVGLVTELPTEPPVVTISFPTQDLELDATALVIEGTVSGEGLFAANTTMEVGRPPGSTAPPSTSSLPLVGPGTTRTFTLDRLIGIGPHVLTVTASNIADLSGSESVPFTNLPIPIRRRHEAEGGNAATGKLVYGVTEGDCRLAVYEDAAIGLVDGSTFVVRGAILDKWRSLTDDFGVSGMLGCPISEERDSVGTSRAQDFLRGRIYADPVVGAHYVPTVFARAIDELGGEVATGFPMADPTDSPGIMQTWLYQQFARPDRPDLMPSTLEISGTPPKLWVQRQGGDLSSFGDVPVGAQMPTFAERFDCTSVLGPCNVQAPTSGPPIQDAGDRFCMGTAWEEEWDDVGGQIVSLGALPSGLPPEWSPVEGHHVSTDVLGIITGTHMATWDMPLTHEFHAGPPKFRSDFNIVVRPVHPFRNRLVEGAKSMKIEFESAYFNVIFANPELGSPMVGDMVFTSGRWVIDCGHAAFKSEIHPPGALVYMRTGSLPDGRPTTDARVWVNGFFTGAPVEFEIVPPPRPSLESVLAIEKPIDAFASVNVAQQTTLWPPTLPRLVRVRFSGNFEPNEITEYGEMKWKRERAYYGRWRVFWSDA